MADEELVGRPFGEVRRALDERELTAVDLVGVYVQRIESYPGLAAYIAVDHERALEAAKRLDHELDRGLHRGPLHGIPVSFKDNIAVAGLPMRCGSAAFAGFTPIRDADVTERVRTGGGIVLGKNGMHEIGIGDPVRDGPLPTGFHPRNPAFLPGGSSSGPAVAVSGGLTLVAIGADTGGSIRNPAASCGIVGFKPTYGRVPTAGSLPLCWSMDTLGAMGREVAAVQAAFTTLVGDATPGQRHPPWKVGFFPDDSLEPLSADAAEALDHVRAVVSEQGSTRVDVPGIDLSVAGPAWLARLAEAASVHALGLVGHDPGYSDTIREILALGAGVSRGDYAESWRTQEAMQAAVDHALSSCDILALPVNPGPPALRWGEWHGLNVFNWYRYCWPFNLTGHPALSLPVSEDADGLPIGIQLVARHDADMDLLEVARWLSDRLPYESLATVGEHW